MGPLNGMVVVGVGGVDGYDSAAFLAFTPSVRCTSFEPTLDHHQPTHTGRADYSGEQKGREKSTNELKAEGGESL